MYTCTEKRRRICEQESNGDGGAGEKKERKTEAGGLITSGTTCRRENCQGRKLKTEFNTRGVS